MSTTSSAAYLQESRTQGEYREIIIISPEIGYLGYMLTNNGIKPVQKKIQAVLDLQPSTILKQLRSFLGTV